MKHFFLSIALTLSLACGFAPATCAYAQQTQGQDEKKYPEIAFENDTYKYDFGKIKRGQSVSHVFKFRNTGLSPLVILDVTTSCGCTTPEFTRKPVMPGQYGEVKVTFNGEGYERFTKSVTLSLNTRKGREILYITGRIVDEK